ncbi:MAG TPA: hypothetical protein VFS21_31200 [Roseiflexaceae bacterium]|nr:hypothetical protein [Roseiflexaceae bacterium]
MDNWQTVVSVLLAVMGASVVVAAGGLLLIARSIRRLNIPREADFFTTMRLVPLALVVLLDLLDFGLDIFSAPVSWIILDRMGLPSLRNRAAIEALIPITGPIPTFTISWVAARLLNLGEPEIIDAESYRPALPERRSRNA